MAELAREAWAALRDEASERNVYLAWMMMLDGDWRGLVGGKGMHYPGDWPAVEAALGLLAGARADAASGRAARWALAKQPNGGGSSPPAPQGTAEQLLRRAAFGGGTSKAARAFVLAAILRASGDELYDALPRPYCYWVDMATGTACIGLVADTSSELWRRCGASPPSDGGHSKEVTAEPPASRPPCPP